MESTILVIGFVFVVLLVYVLFFQKSKETKDKKSYYLKRFIRNKEQSFKHINEVEALASQNNSWNIKAFPDREETFSEYLEKLKTKFSDDYSDSSQQILKKNKLSYSQKQEHTKKLIEQSEDLYLMEVDLGVLNKTWKK